MRATATRLGDTREFTREVFVIFALVAFKAVDRVLVAPALVMSCQVPHTEGSDTPSSTATPVGDNQEEAQVDGMAPQSDFNEEGFSKGPAPRLRPSSSGTLALRSDGGARDHHSSLDLSIDRGEIWNAVYTTPIGLRFPIGVSGADYTGVQTVVVSGTHNEPDGLRTVDPGSSWVDDDQVVTNSAIVDPNDPSEMIWACEGVRDPRREKTQVAATGSAASAVCGSRSRGGVPASGREWAHAGSENAVDIVSSEWRWVVVLEPGDCDAPALVPFDETPVEPLAGSHGEATGVTALNLYGHEPWLLVGDQVLVSADFGRSSN